MVRATWVGFGFAFGVGVGVAFGFAFGFGFGLGLMRGEGEHGGDDLVLLEEVDAYISRISPVYLPYLPRTTAAVIQFFLRKWMPVSMSCAKKRVSSSRALGSG
jgi:hypothetical protein